MNEKERLAKEQINVEKAANKAKVSSIIPELAYYPGLGKYGNKRPLDDKLIPYATACIEMVRLLNDKAAILYNNIVETCKKPEYAEVMAPLMLNTARKPYDSYELLETFQREGPSKPIAEAIQERMEGHKWPPELWDIMSNFVLYGFNKDYESPKVILDNSRELFVALSTSVFYDVVYGDQPIGEYVKAGTASELLGKTPNSRAERRQKKRLIEKFHHLGFGAVSRQTLLYGAEVWYKCRVNPGKQVLVCDELKLSNESILSKWIKPYDDATGYPR